MNECFLKPFSSYRESNQMMKLTMEEECNTGLGLAIGSHEDYCTSKKKNPPAVQFHILFPSKPDDQLEDVDKEKPTKRSAKNVMDTEEDQEQEDMLMRDQGGSSTRKKLKLTKEQSALLEDTFREHHTLNLTQKQELADRLKLRPRQVEVWFQNRRARNKLKQTEVDCEMLRKWCNSLSDENRRLKRELQELRSMKLTYVDLPKATKPVARLAICPSCE